MPNPEWQGDNPFCLIIREARSGYTLRGDDQRIDLEGFADHLIDLDKPGWLTEYSHLMRVPGEWILARKHGSVPVLHLHVAEGEQPYYTARVYATFMPPAGWHGLHEVDLASIKDQAKVQIFGIGKKRISGQVDRMWVLPSGAVCAGDDDGPLADQLAKQRLAAMLQEKINGPDDRRKAGEEAHPEAAGEAGREGGEGSGGEDPQGGDEPGRDAGGEG